MVSRSQIVFSYLERNGQPTPNQTPHNKIENKTGSCFREQKGTEMGAQTVQSIEEVAFTAPEDSMIISLATGKVMEVFGDGMIQIRVSAETMEVQTLYV